jgi:ribose 5-phosphate isomerase B
MKIGFASDHRGYKLKNELINKLKEEVEIEDYGTYSEESTDYPDYAFKLGENVVNKNVDFGVAICGSGIGISIACNKVKGVRCAKVDSIENVIATRNDNDANIIAFGETLPFDKAYEFVKTFITTPASLEEKHVRRRNKIKEYEEK